MGFVNAQPNDKLNSESSENARGSTCLNITSIIDPLQTLNESLTVPRSDALPEFHGVDCDQSIRAPDLHRHDFFPLPDTAPGGVDDFWQVPFMERFSTFKLIEMTN